MPAARQDHAHALLSIVDRRHARVFFVCCITIVSISLRGLLYLHVSQRTIQEELALAEFSESLAELSRRRLVSGLTCSVVEVE
jgi:hypothetical protein